MEGKINNKDLNKELNIVFRYLVKKGVPYTDDEDAVQETAYRLLSRLKPLFSELLLLKYLSGNKRAYT